MGHFPSSGSGYNFLGLSEASASGLHPEHCCYSFCAEVIPVAVGELRVMGFLLLRFGELQFVLGGAFFL